MRNLRIVFMGTPDFAVAILEQLIKHQYTIAGVITAPDKPAGRGRKLNQSAVKTYALSQGLQVLQPTNLKSEEFLDQLTSLNANLQIVVAFRMLPKAVWSLPEYGTFNLHASLLPAYRGAAPIHWAIINGEKTTGVTTFFIDEKIDTGAIILQKECNIKDDETVGQLHDRLMHLGADLVVETVSLIEKGPVQTQEQPKQEEKTAYKLFPENCKVDWTAPLDSIYNKIRGLNPFPSAWSILDNGTEKINVKLYKVSKRYENHQDPIGSIQSTKKELLVAVKDGYLIIHDLKLSGKKHMDVQSLLNGFDLSKQAKMV
ncbi:methionyl-tRNA formyltransferase [Polaribacter pacificus]|uniref:Methionyl-tRNA formyltransferase n=1 Tax=Polaribacter pacificus TaxID=1775173 RepID=A0A917I1H8_9FLAO|nr:methionyl-tRNA formyltransferase [Polaribacter pacificus]GGH03577.1 methionyl-tRNA formyltransferase [Polaribacter pacificus]